MNPYKRRIFRGVCVSGSEVSRTSSKTSFVCHPGWDKSLGNRNGYRTGDDLCPHLRPLLYRLLECIPLSFTVLLFPGVSDDPGLTRGEGVSDGPEEDLLK